MTLRSATIAMWATLVALLVVFALLPCPASAQGVTTQCIVNVAAQGTSDAITSAALPCGTTTNLVLLTAAAANTTSTPTYAPLGSPPLVIIRPDGSLLNPGDISKSGYVVLLSSTGTNWVLLNPASSVTFAPLLSGNNTWTGTNTFIGAVTLPAGAAAQNGAVPHVATNTVLRATSTATYSVIETDGYYAAGDGGGARYYPSLSACSRNAGAGDGGSQVPASNGMCWLADFRGHAYAAQFGALPSASSATNATALNAWLALASGSIELDITCGTYNTSLGLVLPPVTNESVVGAGAKCVVFNYTGASTTANVFTAGSASAPTSGVTLQNLRVSASTSMTGTAGVGGTGFFLRNLSQSHVSNITGGDSDLDGAAKLYNGIVFAGAHTAYADGLSSFATNDELQIYATAFGGSDLWVTNSNFYFAGNNGVHIAGGFGGFYLDTTNIFRSTNNNVLVDEQLYAGSNLQIFIGPLVSNDGNFATTALLNLNDVGAGVGNVTVSGYMGGGATYGLNIQNWGTAGNVAKVAVNGAIILQDGTGVYVQDPYAAVAIDSATQVANNTVGIDASTPMTLIVASPQYLYNSTNYTANTGLGYGPPPSVQTTVQMMTLPSTYAATITRMGYSYTSSGSACTLHSGAGDHGSQVPTSDGKCWILKPTVGLVSLLLWDAKCDANGANDDDGQAINDALAWAATNSATIQFPYTACRSSQTVLQGSYANAVGVAYVPQLDYYLNYVGTTLAPYTGSGVVCDLIVTPCWWVHKTSGGYGHDGVQKISNLSIYRAPGFIATPSWPPTSGVIAKECIYDDSWWTTIDNVLCNGHSRGYHKYDNFTNGLITTVNNFSTCNISGEDVVDDGAAELKFPVGRLGCNSTITNNTQLTGTTATNGSVLTVTAITATSAAIYVGEYLFGTNVVAGTYISSFGTGTGGNGTYNLSASQPTALSGTLTAGSGNRISGHNAYWLITGNGAGPGSIYSNEVMENDSENPGCAIAWENNISQAPQATEYKWFNAHLEFTGQGWVSHYVFCTDGTLANISNLTYQGMTNSDFNSSAQFMNFGSTATFTGVIASNQVTASSVTGTIGIGTAITGGSIPSGTKILSFVSGVNGGAGVYNITAGAGSIGSEPMISGSFLSAWMMEGNYWQGFSTSGWNLNPNSPLYDFTSGGDVFANALVTIGMPAGSGVSFADAFANGLTLTGAPTNASICCTLRSGAFTNSESVTTTTNVLIPGHTVTH